MATLRTKLAPGRITTVALDGDDIATTSDRVLTVARLDGTIRWTAPDLDLLVPDVHFGPELVVLVTNYRERRVIWFDRATGARLGDAPAPWDRLYSRLHRATVYLRSMSDPRRPEPEIARLDGPGSTAVTFRLVGVGRVGLMGDQPFVTVAGEPDAIRAIRPDGTAVWEHPGHLVASSDEGALLRQDAGLSFVEPDGRVRWSAGDLLDAAAGYEGGLGEGVAVLVDPVSSSARCVDLHTGSIRWTTALPTAKGFGSVTPLCAPRHALVTGSGGALHILALADGAIVAGGPRVVGHASKEAVSSREPATFALLVDWKLRTYTLHDGPAPKPRTRDAAPAASPKAEAKPQKKGERPKSEKNAGAAATKSWKTPKKLPADETELRALFESRFASLLENDTMQVLAAKAVTTLVRPTYPAAKGDVAFRWVSRGKPAGGELHWKRFDLGGGARFDPSPLTAEGQLAPRDDAAPKQALRWFDDHPDAGDARGVVHDGRQLYGFETWSAFPLAVDLPAYLALQLTAPGLLTPLLLADLRRCRSPSAASARRVLEGRKKVAKATRVHARTHFADADLSSVEERIDAIEAERFRVVAGDGAFVFRG